MSVLESHHWPGNVRKLQNLIERLVVTADAGKLSVEHLPPSITSYNLTVHTSLRFRETLNLKAARETEDNSASWEISIRHYW